MFYNHSPDEFERILAGKKIGEVTGDGKWIFVPLEPGYVLLVEDMGGRILFHDSEETLPKKYHVMLRFVDRIYLTVTIQGWGFIQVVEGSPSLCREKRNISDKRGVYVQALQPDT